MTMPTPTPEAIKRPVSNDKAYSGTGSGCVRYLRSRGIVVPQNTRIASKYLPVNKPMLDDGEKAVGVSFESSAGHVALWQRKGDKVCSVIDSVGSGRCFPVGSKIFKGFL
jgi:hypothetical protein